MFDPAGFFQLVIFHLLAESLVTNLLRTYCVFSRNRLKMFCSEITAASMLMKLNMYCRTVRANECDFRSNYSPMMAGVSSAELTLPKQSVYVYLGLLPGMVKTKISAEQN